MSSRLKATLWVKGQDVRARTLIGIKESAQKDGENSSQVPLEISATSWLHFVGLERQCCTLAKKVVKSEV